MSPEVVGFSDRLALAFSEGARELGLQWAVSCLPGFLALAEQVLESNEQAGLTRILDPEGMARKHFLDSLTCLLSPGWQNPTEAVDVGTGAGFPGLVLAIAVPGCRFSLVESNARRAEFIRRMVIRLELTAEVIQSRAEDYGRAQGGIGRERFPVGLARAAAKPAAALEYVIPLLKKGGSFVAQLGPSDGQALAGFAGAPRAGTPAWEVLGAELADLRRLLLPGDAGERWLAQFRKVGVTPTRYPRRSGMPARSPLPLFGW